ncbi:unnamed protein product [Spirodela intermedia]|uniref:Uncharacterized protein n=1 Tax=Spirodela intermedia TaxID=51605 RepID=A0A7I8KRK3_SPIIN|nr:unnamed protein product [Spirodela intermedia]
MVSPRKLLQMARKWRRMDTVRRRTIAWTGPAERTSTEPYGYPSSFPVKGSFVVYSSDRVRFVLPLAYINTLVFRELLEISKEEFGLPGDGPIVIPCDAALMLCIVSML